MNKLFFKVFLSGILLFFLISIIVISDDPCRKYVASQPNPIDPLMFSTIAIVNSRTFNEEDIRALFQKIVSDFPIIILATQPIKDAKEAFDLSEILNESLVICNDDAFGFYPRKFANWLQLIDADTSDLPEYSYLNYVDYLGELIVVDKSNYEDFNFHQMMVIIGNVGGGIFGKDYYIFDNDQKIKLYRPHLLASMIYTINKREFFTYAPLWIISSCTVLICLILSISSFLLVRINKILAYLIYKLIQGVLLYIIYIIVLTMITKGSNLIIDLGHLFILIMIGGEIVFWIALFLFKRFKTNA
jgi:hypothetical protein